MNALYQWMAFLYWKRLKFCIDANDWYFKVRIWRFTDIWWYDVKIMNDEIENCDTQIYRSTEPGLLVLELLPQLKDAFLFNRQFCCKSRSQIIHILSFLRLRSSGIWIWLSKSSEFRVLDYSEDKRYKKKSPTQALYLIISHYKYNTVQCLCCSDGDSQPEPRMNVFRDFINDSDLEPGPWQIW